jgi:methionine-rich copper-binding protein CopC
MMRRFQITIAIGAAMAASLLLVATAFSHAGYDSSDPGRNEIVPEAPERVDVFFKQDVVKREGAFYVRVFDEIEAQVSDGDGVVDDDNRRHISTELPADLGPGKYIVEWMTTSDEDGEADDGAFCFYVGVEPTADQEAECAAFDEDVPPAATEPAAEPTDTADAPTPTVAAPSDGDGSSAGLIVGIIVAVVVVAAVVIGGLVWMSRRE